ncbi:MAG: four helix bundle protein [Brachymonas sp.]|nr:four helix bundle protein [Brachymonas sp.]
MQQASQELLKRLLQAQRSSAPLKYLLHADVALAEMRMHWRLAHGWHLVSDGSFEHGALLMAEVGRLLGAWIKNSRAAALRAADQPQAAASKL